MQILGLLNFAEPTRSQVQRTKNEIKHRVNFSHTITDQVSHCNWHPQIFCVTCQICNTALAAVDAVLSPQANKSLQGFIVTQPGKLDESQTVMGSICPEQAQHVCGLTASHYQPLLLSLVNGLKPLGQLQSLAKIS